MISRSSLSPCIKRPRLLQHDTSSDGDDDVATDRDVDTDDSLHSDLEFDLHFVEVANLDWFFTEAFKSLGQLACKDILKAWLKRCHPNKQSLNPYNGGRKWEKSLLEHGFKGAGTKPSYWPPMEGWREGRGCRHLEPDHLLKQGSEGCLCVDSC